MDISTAAYLVLLGAVGAGRLMEMRISRRNQRRLTERGAARQAETHFPWMVALHTGVIVGAGTEVVLLRRPFFPALALTMGALFLLANVVRWWVIATLREHWNVQVMDSTRLGIVTNGPYRWVRHPNYSAVFVEMLALPLIHAAWLTVLLGTLGHLEILRRRLAVEDAVLLASAEYRAAMGAKPRFLPGLF